MALDPCGEVVVMRWRVACARWRWPQGAPLFGLCSEVVVLRWRFLCVVLVAAGGPVVKRLKARDDTSGPKKKTKKATGKAGASTVRTLPPCAFASLRTPLWRDRLGGHF